MRFTVHANGVDVGAVELPVGLFVAARLTRSPGYDAIAGIVSAASEELVHRGVFAASDSDTSEEARSWRRARAAAADLQLDLVDERGSPTPTHFVNLIESPIDRGVVVLASFVAAPTPVGAGILSTRLTPGAMSKT